MEKIFYCNNCQKAVDKKSKSCPYCHQDFKDISCPFCHFKGSEANFMNGCPKCGYLSEEDAPPSNTSAWKYAFIVTSFIAILFTIYIIFYKI